MHARISIYLHIHTQTHRNRRERDTWNTLQNKKSKSELVYQPAKSAKTPCKLICTMNASVRLAAAWNAFSLLSNKKVVGPCESITLSSGFSLCLVTGWLAKTEADNPERPAVVKKQISCGHWEKMARHEFGDSSELFLNNKWSVWNNFFYFSSSIYIVTLNMEKAVYQFKDIYDIVKIAIL